MLLLPFLELQQLTLQDLQSLHVEMIDEVGAMRTRMIEKCSELDFKHGEEINEMRTEISKLYGINFKYVSMQELGMSMEMLARLRVEIMEREHVPWWKSVYNYWRPKIIYALMTLRAWLADEDDVDEF